MNNPSCDFVYENMYDSKLEKMFTILKMAFAITAS